MTSSPERTGNEDQNGGNSPVNNNSPPANNTNPNGPTNESTNGPTNDNYSQQTGMFPSGWNGDTHDMEKLNAELLGEVLLYILI